MNTSSLNCPQQLIVLAKLTLKDEFRKVIIYFKNHKCLSDRFPIAILSFGKYARYTLFARELDVWFVIMSTKYVIYAPTTQLQWLTMYNVMIHRHVMEPGRRFLSEIYFHVIFC